MKYSRSFYGTLAVVTVLRDELSENPKDADAAVELFKAVSHVRPDGSGSP